MAQPTPSTVAGADARKRLTELRKRYTDDARNSSFNALIIGDTGTGKTRLIGTARRPILVHSFDPGGPKTIRHLIEAGDVVVQSFEVEGSPADAFASWERAITELRRNDWEMLRMFGTFALDSLTLWFDAMIRDILRQQRQETMRIQDWGVALSTTKDYMTMLTGAPADFLATCHISLVKDEVTGKVDTKPSLAGQSGDKLPLLFDEVYTMLTERGSSGTAYKLLTQNDGYYKARTRLGNRGQLQAKEEPDIKAILKKCGMSTDDKPKLELE